MHASRVRAKSTASDSESWANGHYRTYTSRRLGKGASAYNPPNACLFLQMLAQRMPAQCLFKACTMLVPCLTLPIFFQFLFISFFLSNFCSCSRCMYNNNSLQLNIPLDVCCSARMCVCVPTLRTSK